MNKILLVFALFLLPSYGQVTVAVSPVSQQFLSALHLRTVGVASLYIVNNGAARTVSPERFYTALIEFRPIDPTTAQAILVQRQSASTPATVARWLGYGAQLTSIALALLSKANIQTAFWVSAGGGIAPQIESIAEGAVPPITGYTSQLLATPISLASAGVAGYSATRTIFVSRSQWKQWSKGAVSMPTVVTIP